jgi:restriction endonuclease S subunit
MKQGWEIKQLGDVCELYQPKTISSKEMVDDGDYPVFGANGIIGKYDKYNHEEPQLLITCRGATCGSINISEPKSWIN